MVLIIANEQDVHARYVSKLIEALGVRVVILDLSRLIGRLRYSHEINSQDVSSAQLIAACPIDFTDVRTIWFRRPALVQVPECVVDGVAYQFIRNEWSESINGMVLGLGKARWVNHPLSQSTASKPIQLERARRVGLKVPDTLITNDPERLRHFLGRHQYNVVHKSLTSPAHRLIDTRKWSDADHDNMNSSLPLAPAIFQELIEGPADIRSVIIDGQLFSVRIDMEASRSQVDSRLDLDTEYAPYELPEEVAAPLLKLMNELGLVFGVVDMKLTGQGDHVFLEINPQGQFLFMEILTRLPIARCLAELLCRGSLPLPLANRSSAHGLA